MVIFAPGQLYHLLACSFREDVLWSVAFLDPRRLRRSPRVQFLLGELSVAVGTPLLHALSGVYTIACGEALRKRRIAALFLVFMASSLR